MRALVLCLLIAGCAGDASAPAAGGVPELGGDQGEGGAGEDSPQGPSAEGEGEGEASLPGEGEGEAPPPPPPGEGEGEGEGPSGAFGDPCDDHDDCVSEHCIEVGGGRLCTVQCTDSCPRDWHCRTVATGGVDATSLCFPPDPVLCTPCERDDDCGGLGDLCLAMGPNAYCGVACDDQRPCEAGYDCLDVVDEEGGVFARQCKPQAGSCQPCEDEDGDGYGEGRDCLGRDCDDARAGTHPGAVEICNRRDDDCDTDVDESFDLDDDEEHCGACDRLCAPAHATGSCEAGVCLLLECEDGFNDLDGVVANGCEYGCHAEAAERCDATVVRHQDGIVVLDGTDSDCDGQSENGFQPDSEGRALGQPCGLGPCAGGFLECDGAGTGLRCSTEIGGSEQVAQLEEQCNGVDDTCVGSLRRIEQDRDGDGWLECVNGPDDVQWGDCDDDDREVSPGARERCDNKDNDCDGVSDREHFEWQDNPVHCGGCATEDTPEFNCRIWFENREGNVQRPGCDQGRCAIDLCRAGFHDANGDVADGCEYRCDVTDEGVETCDGLDNDCDGRIDAADGDLVIVPCERQLGVCVGVEKVAGLCADGGWGPCTREDYAVWSEGFEAGEETRCDDLDNDCDGGIDEHLSADEDGDGHFALGSCAQPADDCDDNEARRHLGLPEVCDGIDNDCDQVPDDGLSADVDRDGHYAPGSCAQPADDCDDGNRLRHPGHAETCDGHDNDCDGAVDPHGSVGCVGYHQDVDNDGWGVGDAICMCAPADPRDARQGGDCFDGNGAAHPGQGGWFNGHRGDGSFDYNCDGQQQRRWPTDAGTCRFFGDFCDGGDGYEGGAPGCGGHRNWISDCYYSTSGWPWEWGCYWRHRGGRTQSCR